MKPTAIAAAIFAALILNVPARSQSPRLDPIPAVPEMPGEKWVNRIEIGGELEVEAARHGRFGGGSTSDVTVATATVGLRARIHDWVAGDISLLYEEDETPLEIDVAAITVAPPKGIWSLKAGQFYVPFGTFESHLISDPVTLELAEARETALLIGVSVDGFSGSVFLFNGDNHPGGRDRLAGYGAAAGYAAKIANAEVTLGTGYISDIGDSDNLQTAINDALGNNRIADHVPGWTASAKLRYGNVSLIGGYVSALGGFQATEVPFGPGGARPSAWTIEAAYGFKLAGRHATFAVAYQGTDEALALELPRRRYLAGLSVDAVDHVTVAVEWAYDRDYGAADGGTGETANTVTGRIAVSF